MLASIINLLYPAYCLVCNKSTGAWDKNICRDCLKKIKMRVPPFCTKCGRQIAGDRESQNICPDCRKNSPYFDRAFSVFLYDEILKNLVHDFKYKRITSLLKEFSQAIIPAMEEYGIGKNSHLVISVPMHRHRLFAREINPSHILAENISKKLRLRYCGAVLKKAKNTPLQSKLSRAERIKNVKGSFSVRKDKESEVRDKNILLVDDLFTTGSTANECARVLKGAGSGLIEVVTLARGDSLP